MSKEDSVASTAAVVPSRITADIDELEELLEKVIPYVIEYERQSATPDTTKVVNFYEAPDLMKECSVALPDEPADVDKVFAKIKEIMHLSVRTHHPRFMDKLFAGTDAVGQIAEFLTAVLNTNVYIYAVAPLFSIMEVEIVKKWAEVIGLDGGACEGLLVPGGSFANFMGMTAARHKHFPHVRMDGWKEGDNPIGFCSAQAHYSVRRASMMLGFGMNGIQSIKADSYGRMNVEALEAAVEKAIADGKKPFFVNATCGTTVMGGFDYFDDIRRVCDKYGMWMHVDAAWGVSACFTPTMAEHTKGMEKADSITWDGHKSMGLPIYAAGIIVQGHVGLLQDSNSSNAEYLFLDHDQQSYDIGDMSLQCGRRNDALKVYLSWLRHGTKGYRARVEQFTSLARYLGAKVKKTPNFRLLADPVYGQVCFWYIPPSIREKAEKDFESVYDDLNRLTPMMYRRMQKRGNMLVSCNPLSDQGLPSFFRVVVNAPTLTEADMDFIIAEVEQLGEGL